MANELENALGKLLGYVILGVIIVALVNRASLAKKEFLQTVEPALKSLESEADRQRRQLDGDDWNVRLSQMEKKLSALGA